MPMAAQECRGIASTNASSDQTPVLLWHYQALKNPTCRNNWKVIWKNTLTGKVLQKLNVPPFFSSLILGQSLMHYIKLFSRLSLRDFPW